MTAFKKAAAMLTVLQRPHTPQTKIRSKEEALIETPFLKFDDSMWLQQLRSWLNEEE